MSVGTRNGRIDAMRGVAILLVLLHHFNIAYPLGDTALARAVGPPLLHAVTRNGNYAVTMFFAISGYLITRNAQRRWGTLGNVDARAFWRFRAARIAPCVLLLLAITNALAFGGLRIFADTPDSAGDTPLWRVDLAAVTCTINVLMQHVGWVNYVLCVQWSLAIEEVFYLAFPILCLLMKRDRSLLAAWAVFIAIGPVWRHAHQGSAYAELNAYLACFDGIACGCCAAVFATRITLPPRIAAAVTAVTATALVWFYLHAWIGDDAVWGVSVIAAATAIILVAQHDAGACPSSVPSAPLRACGRLSYELYLFHLVVLALERTLFPPGRVHGDATLSLGLAFLVGSMLLAWVVARFWSEPLNRRLRGRAPPQTSAGASRLPSHPAPATMRPTRMG